MTRRILCWTVAALLTLPLVLPAQAKKPSRKKKARTEAADTLSKKKETEYEKIVKRSGDRTVRSSFITAYHDAGKLYFEIPKSYLGREMLLGQKPSASSDPTGAVLGYMESDPQHIRMVLQDSTLIIEQVGTRMECDPADERMREALRRNYMNTVLRKHPVKAWNADSTAVVIEVTELFNGKEKALKPFAGKTLGSIFSVSYDIKSDWTTIEQVKSFDDNLSVVTDYSASYTISLLGLLTISKGEARAKVTTSLLLLPERKMHPRVSDARVGVFRTDKQRLTNDRDRLDSYAYANRWRLEPVDTAAYLRGETVEPAKPIVFYVDNTFPEAWKEPIRRAVLRWNKAFEKIGFKNVMVARDFPVDDPEFDPDNLKYSCIRYIPTPVANAMGPSWVDPATGEIINASVLVYSDVTDIISQWRFVQTAQIDPRVRAAKLPQEVLDESLEYVVAHEVGHTLGLMHNMGASAAYPVDSLRSPSFTARYGTTPSIMDYARFNYVAQPSDKGVKLTPPELGVYDYYAIEWLYRPVFGKTAREEQQQIESWVDARAGDPLYRYGQQQVMARYDPSAIEEDLGDDPVKAGEYGIRNLRYILPRITEWIPGTDVDTRRWDMYQQVLTTYYRYLRAATMNVGGIYLDKVKEGTPGERYRAVPRSEQRRALRWVLGQLRQSDWLADPAMVESFGMSVYSDLSRYVYKELAKTICTLGAEVTRSALIAEEPYTVREFYDDLYREAFDAAIRGRRLTAWEKVLQKSLVAQMREATNKVVSGVELTDTGTAAPSLGEILAYGLDDTGLLKAHADQLYQAIERIPGGVDSQLPQPGFGYEPGEFQRHVTVEQFAEITSYYLVLTTRVKNLLQSRIATAHPDDRAHYRALLYSLEQKPGLGKSQF